MHATPPDRDSLVPPAETAPPPDPEVAALLADKPALWAALQEASGEYVAVVDRAGFIRSCNRVDDGFTVDQVVGHSFVRFTTPESSAALTAALREVFARGTVRTLETTVRRLDGSINYFSLRMAPIRRAGRTVAALACCANIRPLKASEQALTHERNVLKRLLEIQERERQLVSYEIHDGLAQYLAGALMHLQACPPDAAGNLEVGLRLLRAATEESRRLIGGLRPPALDELGIVDAVESLVADARAEIPDVSFAHALPGDRVPPQVETIAFRIVQEAVGNARRHSQARHLRVDLARQDHRLHIRVADDGRGFDPEQVPEERFGLEGIRQRARLLGGESRIASRPGAGTTIDVALPLPQA